MESFTRQASSIMRTIWLTPLPTETPSLRWIWRADHRLCRDLLTTFHSTKKEKFTCHKKRRAEQSRAQQVEALAWLIPVSSERRIKLYNLIKMEIQASISCSPIKDEWDPIWPEWELFNDNFVLLLLHFSLQQHWEPPEFLRRQSISMEIHLEEFYMRPSIFQSLFLCRVAQKNFISNQVFNISKMHLKHLYQRKQQIKGV